MKHILLLTILGLCLGLLFAQATPAPATPRVQGFQNVRPYVETQVITIEFKSQIPSSDVYQAKADTYQKAGEYKFNFNSETVKEQSEILLNKWLKESK